MASPLLPTGEFPPPALIANPYPLYAALRRNNPVFRLPFLAAENPGVWVLTRHRDVQRVLKDGRFSVDRRRASVVRENLDRVPAQLLGEEGGLRSMLVMDPPDHTRVRGLVNKAFTPRRVAALRPRIEAVVDDLLSAVVRSGGMDVIADFAGPLPAIVIAELLGVPAADHRRFKAWSTELIAAVGLGPGDEAPKRIEAALQPLLEYLRRIIAERRADPRDDLISGMILAQEERDALTDAELLATSNLLLLAGNETTTNLIGNGLLALLCNPDQLDRLRAEPRLLETAIEELLRFDSPVQATARVATEDVELDGQSLGAGALVITIIGAANRDPEVFEDPERLEVGRGEVPHLSFGWGAHFCLGATLARLEGEIALGALLDRFPKLALGGGELRYRANVFLRGLEALPVAF